MVSNQVSATDHTATIDRIARNEYDLAIIGGGIAGAGIARDAAMRGLDTVLIEQADFASGTTAWSTRLAHGGLRYLEQYDFGLVFESLQERETLAEIAPHLVDPLSFLIPQYDESRLERTKLRLGMTLYDVLSYNKTMPNHDSLSTRELLEMEPALPGRDLQGGFVYHDRQIEFVERLCLETLLDAAAAGADLLNHAEAVDIRTAGGRVRGITVEERLGKEVIDIDSTTVVNAAGPWADEVLADLSEQRLIRPAKGIHIVVPQQTTHAVTLPTTDGRVVFIVPWNGKSLIGTTDTDYEGDPQDARATSDDVEYLLNEVGRFLPDLDTSDILYTYAGVRPLYDSGGSDDSASVSRDHEVVDHENYDGLLSLVGAKITPYRAAAEDATDAVAEYLSVDAECETATTPLPGGREESIPETDLPWSTVEHLRSLYGARASTVIEHAERDERLAEPLCDHSNDILAQVTVAVEEEYARRLTDVMFRRCTVGYTDCEGRDAVETVAEHMTKLLDWDEKHKQEEIEAFEAVLDHRHAFEDDLRDSTAA